VNTASAARFEARRSIEPAGNIAYHEFMRIEASAASDVGYVRSKNEDIVLLGDRLVRDGSGEGTFFPDGDSPVIFAVADGMGGMERGEEASEIALERLRALTATLPRDLDSEELEEIFHAYARDTHEAMPPRSGTTLVALFFYRGKAFRFHAGDSRLYRLRGGSLARLTRDHSLREYGNMPSAPSNIIVNALGGGDRVFLEFADVEGGALAGDLFLLSSDGLHDLVPGNEIEAIIREKRSGAAGALVDAAKDHGGGDNVSIVLAELREG